MLDILSIFTEAITLRWLLINSLISIIVYKFVYKKWSFFSQNNVKHLRGLPLLGAQWRLFTGQESMAHSVSRLYKSLPNEKIVGVFEMFGHTSYLIRDPELIRRISIKDFEHFMNHQSFGDPDLEPLFARSLFTMNGQRWKSMRSNLSPAFTGSKMRLMFSLIGDVSNIFCDHLKNEIKNNNGKIECDLRDLFSRFTNDCIASCAFGMNIDSMKDKNNEFFTAGYSLSDFQFMAFFTAPKLAKFFNITLFKKEHKAFFREIVKNNMDYREKNGIVRNDMINILLQLKKGTLIENENEKEVDGDIGFATVQESSLGKVSSNQEWDEDDLIAQSMTFFIAGFSTVALAISFLAHDLAVHPDIQEKLYQEILETKEQLNGKPITYETIQKMKYLDMVLSESLRMWPQAPGTDRVVSKQYELEIEENHKIILNPGEVVLFPTYGLHRDEKYFPNPEQFDPERFNNENKGNIMQGSYLPFGIGPRNCIASRFALMECKACIFYLLSNCKLEMCAKTQHPLKIKISANLEAENGFWVKLKLRE